ncbi:hypothetical protein [Cellulomonas sp. C5510]|uniref:hypothetical protein n=1 Tax=Cellulomonas sp. C5510 TaxID=2871170 RepID=UPI001C9897FE|nr:hypothetical protein [Cellulomonas sp. C5510]QZN86875.1 hypothetical protein K5O09_07130 [Cellulomonas sp. C5510]
MADLDARVTIARPGDDLVLNEAPFELIGVGFGGRTWRRTTVEGKYQHGRALVGAVLDTTVLTVQVRCLGSSWIAAQNRVTELMAAVSPFDYQVTVEIEGHVSTVHCEPADVTPASGDVIDKFRAMQSMQEYTLTMPVRV